jgi:hypothetical protein
MPHSPLDIKALGTIAILMDRRETWSVITYGDLADRLAHVPQGLSQILDRVGAWCRSIGKQELPMLVIDEEGKPRQGMYEHPPGAGGDPVTPQTYDQRRVRLWREDWTGVTLPTLEQIATAYAAEH